MLKDFYSSVLTDKYRNAYRSLHLGFRECTPFIQISGMSQEEFSVVLNAYQRENPLVYWVDFHSGIPVFYAGGNVLLKPIYLYKDRIKEINAAFDKACSEIGSYPADPRKQVMAIVNWMTRLKYVNTRSEHEHNVVGPLLYGEGVCEAFSQLFQAFCDHFKIDCMVAIGSVTGMSDLHAWNVVSYGGKCYNVDMTQAIAIAQKTGIKLFNVMVPDYIISDYHAFDKPYCGILADNPYFLEGKAFTNETELSKMLVKFSKTEKSFCLLDAAPSPINVNALSGRIDTGRVTSFTNLGRMYIFNC